MCKTISGKLDEIREEIRNINSVKFMSGITYEKCVELNSRLKYLIAKYNFFTKFTLEKK